MVNVKIHVLTGRVYFFQPMISISDEETEPAIILEDALDEIGDILHTVEGGEAGDSELEEEDVHVVNLADSVLGKFQKSCESAKKRNKINEEDVKLHPKSSRKKSHIESEDIQTVEDVAEKEEDVELSPIAPARSLRSYSKKTPVVHASSQKSAVWDEQIKESETGVNDSKVKKSESKVRDSRSMRGKVREKKEGGVAEMVSYSEVEKEEENIKKSKRDTIKSSPNVPKKSLRSYSKRTSSVSSQSSAMNQGDKMKEKKGEQMEDDAADSMVSDSCDSDASEDIIIPNIKENVGHRIISESNERMEDFMSPVIENIRITAKKSTRKRNLQEEYVSMGDVEPNVDVAYTKIVSPPKSNIFGKREDEKEAAGHMTRSRSRRKTISDLSSQNKGKDLKRRSLARMCSFDCTPEKNTKITEYFEITPIRTRGKVIFKDENVEIEDAQKLMTEKESRATKKGEAEESSGIKRNGIGDASQQNTRSPKKNKKDSHAHNENIEEVIKTRSRSENEGIDTESKRQVEKKLTPKNKTFESLISVKPLKTCSRSQSESDKNNDEIASEMSVTKKLTPKKTPRARGRNLRSNTVLLSDEISVIETLSSSNDSSITEFPRKTTRTTKKM